MTTIHECRTSREDLLDLVPDSGEGQLTPKQSNLVNKLINDLRRLDPELGEQAEQYTNRMNGRWTRGRNGTASVWIDRLISKVRELKTPREIEDGMYLMDGQVYKVQHAVHGSGKQYAKRLVPNDPGERAIFEYAPGIIRKIRPEHQMTMDQAKEWGALYGTCVRCGRTLTAEDSIERMMGPICATKF
jgi:hypothetical protein